MIAYNHEWLDALSTKEAAEQWNKKGLLSDEKWKNVQEQYHTGFYSPNVFVRIGLAVFCLILLLAMLGLMGWIVEPNTEAGFALFCIFWGMVWILALEFILIRGYRHFGSGLDDMLLYAGATAVVVGLGNLLLDTSEPLVWCCLALPFLVAGSIRYLDRLMAAAAFVCAVLIVLLIVKDIPNLAVYLLPFSGMLFSAAVYFFAQKGKQKDTWRHRHGVFAVFELLALLTFYASGNYWFVQQTGADWFSVERVPLGWFFWVFTFAVPCLFIWQGLRGKDRLALDVGLGCAVAAVFTFRYYHHVLPLAWAAAVGGAVVFVVSYLSIQYLRKNAVAYTYEEDGKKSLLQKAQEQIFEQTIASQSVAPSPKKDTLGGGQYGGGGAGSDF